MTDTTKIMPVEQCGAVNKCQSHPSGYKSSLQSGWRLSEPTKERVATYALQQLEAARAKDVATREANLPALHNNIAVAQRVEALMKEIGMPVSYSERDPHSRSRYPKTIRRDAGYITDLRRECKTDDGFAAATRTYEDLKRRYEEYAAEGKREAEEAAREREREQQAAIEKRKADMELAGILLRYGLPVESTWAQVLEHLCGKHQRLALAVAMQQTRNDWNDGPYRVTDALRSFTIQTDEDKNIAASIAGCLVDFDDGRVFRDCEWNYGALFASVATTEAQLVTDVQTALQRAGEDRG